MTAAKISLVLVVGAGWLLAGCHPPEPPTSATQSLEALPALDQPAELEVMESPVPSPATSIADGTPGLATTHAVAGGETLYDHDGNPVTGSLEIVQHAVRLYEEWRFSSVEGDAQPLPPLKDLDELVRSGILKKLPPAPAGQRFVFDPKTKSVSLSSQ